MISQNKIDASFFDQIWDRSHTGSIKYDLRPDGWNPQRADCRYPNDLIPMWVADMDFKVPPAVEQALIASASHGIFGYTDTDPAYDEALVNWYQQRMNWTISPEWNTKTPGVIFAISAAIRALTEPGDGVLIFQPVYYPFAKVIPNHNRKLVVSPLKLTMPAADLPQADCSRQAPARYEMDFEDLERKITEQNVRLVLISSPHNPVCRVWTREELTMLGEICLKHDVWIISDEIHSDLIFDGYRHIPLASISEAIADRTITCTAPSKTFNLAGLQASNIFISNQEARRKFRRACNLTGYSELNTMAVTATRAAYQCGAPWLEALLSYLQENIKLLEAAFPPVTVINTDDAANPAGTANTGIHSASEQVGSRISLIHPQGTYLMWLDCRAMNRSDEQLADFFLNKAGLWLHNGSTFGQGGSGFMRMNIACPQSTIKEAISRIQLALSNEDKCK